MKFITEEYLRDLYRKEPFNNYELKQGERLTPGARQYLSDRGIRMLDDISCKNNKISEEKQVKEVTVRSNNTKKKAYCKLKAIEAELLIFGRELLNEDIILAQNIINLSKNISNIRNAIEEKSNVESILCKTCSGMTLDNFYDDIDDCFEITEFYIQLEKGYEILKLHYLRCYLREVEVILNEFYEEDKEDDNLGNKVMRGINAAINTLSQMICSISGGKRCQRKS